MFGIDTTEIVAVVITLLFLVLMGGAFAVINSIGC